MDYNIELTTMVIKRLELHILCNFLMWLVVILIVCFFFTSLFQTFDMHNTER